MPTTRFIAISNRIGSNCLIQSVSYTKRKCAKDISTSVSVGLNKILCQYTRARMHGCGRSPINTKNATDTLASSVRWRVGTWKTSGVRHSALQLKVVFDSFHILPYLFSEFSRYFTRRNLFYLISSDMTSITTSAKEHGWILAARTVLGPFFKIDGPTVTTN